MDLGVRLRLAAGDLAAQPLRTLLGVVVLAPLVSAWFLLASVSSALAERPPSRDPGTLIITGQELFDPSIAALTEADRAAVAAVGGTDVESVTPAVVRVVEVDDRTMQLRGADPATWGPVHGLEVREGRAPAGVADEAAVTESLARAAGWHVGDAIRVFGSDLEITGIYRAAGTKVAAIWLTLERAERLFERPGEYQSLAVDLAPGADAEAVRRRLIDAFADLLVIDESRLQFEASTGQRELGEMARLFTSIGFVALAAGSANATALMLAERVRSVGLLRVMGFPARFVRHVLALRALLMTVGSIVIGLAIALPFVVAHPPVLIQSYPVDIRVRPLETTVGILASLVGAALGAVLAARRTLRRPVTGLLGR